MFRNVPPGLRRPPRGTFVVAAATAATALVTAATVANASASTPAGHSPARAATGLSAPAGQVSGHRAGPPQAATAKASPVRPAPASASPAKASPAHQSGAAHLTVKVAAKKGGHSRQHQAVKKLRRPYRLYDSVTPSAIPAHQAAAVYSTGAYYATPGQIRHLGHALWIDTTGHNYAASVLDVEPGDATPPQAASWAFHRLRAHPHGLARIYTMRSQWPAVKSAVRGLPGWMQTRVRWWIADPTGVPHIVPGAHATQWYWGPRYDLSLVKPGF